MRIINVLLLVLIVLEIKGQTVGGVPGKGLDMQTNSGGFVTQLPMAPPETKGDVYLNEQWFVGNITLTNHQKLNGYLTRVNLQTNHLLINVNNQVRMLSSQDVVSFSWFDINLRDTTTFVSGRQYKANGIPIEGFFRVIQTGKWSLLSKPTLVLIKSTYVPALDAGERNNKLVKREELYLTTQFQLYKTNLSKNKFLRQFPTELQSHIKEFISNKKLSTKTIIDLRLLTDFLNTQD